MATERNLHAGREFQKETEQQCDYDEFESYWQQQCFGNHYHQHIAFVPVITIANATTFGHYWYDQLSIRDTGSATSKTTADQTAATSITVVQKQI